MENNNLSIPIGKDVIYNLRKSFAAKISALFIGDGGIGKTDIVKQFCKESGIKYLSYNLSVVEPYELLGFPKIENGKTIYAYPEMLPMDGEGVLVLEEVNRCHRDLQSAVLQLIDERKLNQYTLPDGWIIVLTVNNPKDNMGRKYFVTDLDYALVSRCLTINVHADAKIFIEWAVKNSIHPLIISLVKEHKNIIKEICPRVLTMVSKLLKVMTENEIKDESVLFNMFHSQLGPVWIKALIDIQRRCSIDVYQLLKDYHESTYIQKEIVRLSKIGKTDELYKVSDTIKCILNSIELKNLADNGEFKIEAFDEFLRDYNIPGDLREQIRTTFENSKYSVHTLPVSPEDIICGNYEEGTDIYNIVNSWIEKKENYKIKTLVHFIIKKIDDNKKILSFPKNMENINVFSGHISDYDNRLKVFVEKDMSIHV